MNASVLRNSSRLGFFAIAFSIAPVVLCQQTVSDEVSADDWVGVRAAYEADGHAAVPTEDGFKASNPGQCWHMSFDGRGFLVEPKANEWNWGLELLTYGFAGSEHEVSHTACVSADGGRVAYTWGDALEEWYINDTRGLS